MNSITPNNFGISIGHDDLKTGLLYTCKKEMGVPSSKLYKDISTLIESVIKENKDCPFSPETVLLKKHLITQVHITDKEISFCIENGKSLKYSYPLNSRQAWFTTKIFSGSLKNITLTLHSIDKVVEEVIKKTNFKKVLYLYSSGGAGHISAKNAIRDKALIALQEKVKAVLVERYGIEDGREVFKFYFPNQSVFFEYCKAKSLYEEKDVLVDFVGKIGKMGADAWDEAQMEGDIEKQEKLAGMQWLTQIFFAVPVFFHALATFLHYKPERLVSTQAVCNDAILSAMAVYNVLFKPQKRKNLKLELFMTDMPTTLSGHFFGAIKSISSGQKKRILLYAPEPMNAFEWKIKAGIDKENVVELNNLQLPIRPAFLNAVQKFKETPFDPTRIQIKISCKQEREMLEGVIGTDAISGSCIEGVHYVYYHLSPEDEGYYLMLGSQPTKSALYKYMDQFIEWAKHNGGKPLHLFLFLGKYQLENGVKGSLYKELSSYLIKNEHELPANLKIVPLSFQDAEQMVGFFARCNSITRSGGATCMELMVMEEVVNAIKQKDATYKKPFRFVHAQQVPGRSPIKSIPLWERGNFFYMRDKCISEIVTPETLLEKIKAIPK